jgi:hypothetical protein
MEVLKMHKDPTKQLLLHMPVAMHKQLKLKSVEDEKSMTKIILELLEKSLEGAAKNGESSS